MKNNNFALAFQACVALYAWFVWVMLGPSVLVRGKTKTSVKKMIGFVLHGSK